MTESHAAGRGDAGVQPGAGEEEEEGEMKDGEPPESAEDFEGLVLWDVDHMGAGEITQTSAPRGGGG